MKHLLRSLLFLTLVMVASASNAAVVLNVDTTGKLLGASGVQVNGTAYDVLFKDGKCTDLYDGCETTDFIFNTREAARNASLALLDQVFNAFPVYDFDPSLTNGCPGNIYYLGQLMGGCFVMTPFERLPTVGGPDQVVNSAVFNDIRDSYDAALSLGSDIITTPSFDTNTGAQRPMYIYAVWAAAGQTGGNTVPEPSVLALLGLGLGLMRWTARRKA